MRSMSGMVMAAVLGAGMALTAPAMAHDGATAVDWKPYGYYAPPPRYYAPPPPAYYDAPPPPRARYYAPPPVYYYAPPRPRYHRPPPPPGVGLYFRF
ncbi:hypothetical protein [Falsiroseomonas sp.]|uniref:hypothetical protein n=1 Tax=Falsiroseomonas sp. TaxID=2870721 RepID=UPI003F6ECB46